MKTDSEDSETEIEQKETKGTKDKANPRLFVSLVIFC